MASFTTPTTTSSSSSSSNVSSNLVGRERNIIASSFVKQYYTILNKAPCFIHNFYSHDSTFIHGTIEMANQHYTEPIVGREKIKRKMEDLKLNDCRAKIKQIDCLETLAGGLVIQVIGELSNNGKPMRRFLQTFVLAPSPDETRQDGPESQTRMSANVDSRRGVHLNENTSSSHNQKFFVLNSIFRYQDDGPDSEFEDDAASVNANTSIESANGGNEVTKENEAKNLASPLAPATAAPVTVQQSVNIESESKRSDAGVVKVVSNGTGNIDRKSETSEKSNENGKSAADQSQAVVSTSNVAPVSSSSTATSQSTSTTTAASTAPRPQPSNEPKTWANMVRNAHPPSALIQTTNVTKNVSSEQQQHQNQPSHHHQLQQQQQPQQQQQHQHQTQSQSQSEQQAQQNVQNNNNRRRHIIRKPSNKSTGARLKNRPRPAPTGKPMV